MRLVEARTAALIASIAVIVALTLVPTASDNDLELVPFGDLADALASSDVGRVLEVALESAANILLFVPLGAALAYAGFRAGRAACVGISLSVGIEIAQLLLIPGRTTAVDDVILNALGLMLGYAAVSRWKTAA